MPSEEITPIQEGGTSGLCQHYKADKDEMHRCDMDNGFCPFKGDPNRCGEED